MEKEEKRREERKSRRDGKSGEEGKIGRKWRGKVEREEWMVGEIKMF